MSTTPVNPGAHRTPRESTPIRAGRQLQGRYNLINRIATGGMGEVWRARDTRTGTLVAAKVLRPELTGEEISLSRLRIEATNAMRAHHPNIAAVLDSGESNGQGWIVMELVQGNPLTDYVGDGKRLSAQDLIPIVSQAAYALDGAAQAGIVHRDIKPANIMVRDDGMVKLTDFGISYSAGQVNLTAVGMVMGTAQYLAPEQAMGSQATPAGDLYSLGIIAYEALAGYRPFTGKSVVEIAMAHVSDEVPALPPDVPAPLAEVVYRLLEKKPENRPSSGTALVRSLKRVADEIGASISPRPLSPPPTVTSARHSSSGTNQPTTPDAPAEASASLSPHPRRMPLVTRRSPTPGAERSTWTGPDASSMGGAPSRPGTATRVPAIPPNRSWPPVTHATAGSPRRTAPSASPPRGAPANRTGMPSSRSSAPESSDFGMWVIAGLGLLTVILIFIAMLRDREPITSVHGDPVPSAVATVNLEVQPWLAPTLVS